MFAETRAALRPTLTLLAFFTVLTGLAYPLAITVLAQALMPGPAGGSLIRRDGRIIGSELIGQTFSRPGYFHPRPSAAGKAGYDASSSTGSNYAPGAKALADRIAGDIAALRRDGVKGAIPADLVTTSGSGLDPDITPESALLQVPRIARARGIGAGEVRALIAEATQAPLLGIIGELHVNVLRLNRQLDAKAGTMRR